MDFSTTPTKVFHEDLDFSMENIYSPSACKTEKKKMVVSFETHLHNLPTEHLCVSALVFFSRRRIKSWKKQMVSQVIIRNVPLNKSLWYLALVFPSFHDRNRSVSYRQAQERLAHSQILLIKMKWAIFTWVFHGKHPLQSLRFYKRFHSNMTMSLTCHI